jgi:hypothetical protein
VLWVIIGIVAVVAFFVARGILRNATPAGFAKQLAVTQLISFHAIRAQHPQAEPLQLYQMVLETRPGYDADRAHSIINMAEAVASGVGEPVRFWVVVMQLAAFEFQLKTNQPVTPFMPQIAESVASVISENL